MLTLYALCRVLKKTVEYVTLFARFKDSETAIAARKYVPSISPSLSSV